MYQYTLLKQDGTTEDLGTQKKKMELKDMYKTLDCQRVQIIPRAYYKDLGRYTMWGDEEARFNSENIRNPHFDVLLSIDGSESDVVGNIIKEQKVKS